MELSGATPAQDQPVQIRMIVRRALVLVGAAAAVASLGAAPVQAATKSTPIYSDPAWWPLREAVKVDCTHHNNCPHPHTFWGVDVVPSNQTWFNTASSDAAVYAMGAGIVHIGDANGAKCGTNTKTDFGTWVWVDHGGGVVSKYGHLGTITVHDGQQVYPTTELGTVGNTGNAVAADCHIDYVDFEVRHDGIDGPTVEFSTTDAGAPNGDLFMCTGAGISTVTAVVHQIDNGYDWTRIDQIPHTVVVPASTAACIPTAARSAAPTKETLTRSKHSLVAAWATAPAGVNDIRVEFGAYHPSTKAWDTPQKEQWRDLGPGTSKDRFTKLTAGHKYRARVWFHTAAGWSPAGSWVTSTAS